MIITILSHAVQIGRDIEAHASERFTAPDNYDAVCEYAAEEITRLEQELNEQIIIPIDEARKTIESSTLRPNWKK